MAIIKWGFRIGEKFAEVTISDDLTIEELEVVKEMLTRLVDTRITELKRAGCDTIADVLCKDCKNSEHWYRDRRRCFLWSEDGVSVFDDGFCSYAERRTENER